MLSLVKPDHLWMLTAPGTASSEPLISFMVFWIHSRALSLWRVSPVMMNDSFSLLSSAVKQSRFPFLLVYFPMKVRSLSVRLTISSLSSFPKMSVRSSRNSIILRSLFLCRASFSSVRNCLSFSALALTFAMKVLYLSYPMPMLYFRFRSWRLTMPLRRKVMTERPSR